ncbi:hypothetical protein ABZ930_18130 [Streptomyces sp. NPDC046716]|uniref:hypothetical protein n=1 Tax=Streptomyces sp. NPDC046716 TaxID=3157093 RepID=UPI0033FB07F5
MGAVGTEVGTPGDLVGPRVGWAGAEVVGAGAGWAGAEEVGACVGSGGAEVGA